MPTLCQGSYGAKCKVTEPSNIPHSNSVAIFQATDAVSVPCIVFEACQDLEQQLQLINPLSGGNYLSTTVYNPFVNILGSHLRNSCTRCSCRWQEKMLAGVGSKPMPSK